MVPLVNTVFGINKSIAEAIKKTSHQARGSAYKPIKELIRDAEGSNMK